MCIHSFNNVRATKRPVNGSIADIKQIYYPILVQSIVGFGGIFVGTNPSYTSYELLHALKTSKAKLLIVEPEILNAPRDTALKLGIPKDRILLLAEPKETETHEHASWRTLLEHGEQDWIRFDDLETAKSTPAFLMFSSGTTGLPKAAIQSHYNLIAEHTLVHENPSHPEPYHMSRIICLPMFHTAIGPYCHISTLRSGRESYIMRRFAMPDFLRYMDQFKVTSMIIVPPQVVAMVNAAKDDEAFVRKCLRHVHNAVGGAAPLDAETQGKLQALMPRGSAFVQLWAMTETTCIASYFYHPEQNLTASVGRFVPNIDVKLVNPDPDSDGEEVGPYDVRGELCVRGPTVIRGYLDNPEANARDWDNEGYFRTGDILYCDSKTKLWYVVDRRKELIKVRGFQVAPNEIEGVLLSHPDIRDAAVIGITEGEAGELPRGYVVTKPGAKLTEKEVKEWVAERLARFKQLEAGVKFVESIPKTVSGKILKRILREEAKREMGAKL